MKLIDADRLQCSCRYAKDCWSDDCNNCSDYVITKKEIDEQPTIEIPEVKWIPVSERLPNVYEEVLVTDEAGGMTNIEIDFCGRYEDTGERFWYSSQNVTAWMPLPEPYNSESEVDND